MGTGLHSSSPSLSQGLSVFRGAKGLSSGPGLFTSFGGVPPTTSFNFASGTLDPRITFARASTGTFVGSNGLVQTAPVNTPRFEYDPITLAMKGLLVEEQRTNLVLYSEDQSNAAWGMLNLTVGSNVATAPDGTSNADSLSDTATSATHTSSATFTPAASTTYTYSLWLRKGGLQYVAMQVAGGGIAANIMVSIDFNNNGNLTTLNGSPVSTKCVQYLGGWYRAEVRFTTTSTAVVTYYVCGLGGNTYAQRSYAGTGAVIAYVWGAQIEAGAFALSYIPTAGAAATRSPDNPTVTGTNFTSWYNQSAGTWQSQFDTLSVAGAGRVVGLDVATEALAYYSPNQVQAYDGSSSLVSNAAPGLNLTVTQGKGAYGYGSGTASITINGTAIVTGSQTWSGKTIMYVGYQAGNNNFLNGHIRKIDYYNTRLPDAQLQAITT